MTYVQYNPCHFIISSSVTGPTITTTPPTAVGECIATYLIQYNIFGQLRQHPCQNHKCNVWIYYNVFGVYCHMLCPMHIIQKLQLWMYYASNLFSYFLYITTTCKISYINMTHVKYSYYHFIIHSYVTGGLTTTTTETSTTTPTPGKCIATYFLNITF